MATKPVRSKDVGKTKMALKIIDGNATPNSIALFFSDAVDEVSAEQVSSYTIYLSDGTSFSPATAHYHHMNRAVMLSMPSGTPLDLGTGVLVTASLGSAPTSVGLQVNGEAATRKKEAAEVTSAVEDAVSYPILTEPIEYPPFPGGGRGSSSYFTVADAGSVSSAVGKAVSGVLGWKANPEDPRGFIGALSQSFNLAEVEGHVEATWNPRSYAVQTDLGGGITGAQASLYTRAKAALDSAMPLLDGLYPLDPDADPAYVKALREMARSQMSEIVKELGTVGGPSVLRVNTYFGILLGQEELNFSPGASIVYDPDQIGGTLSEIRDTYGVYFANNPFSNSVEDEQDVTNFRIISDYLTSLRQSWISNGQFFLLGKRGQPAFFGTQLVLLSRQFSVIGETVNQVRFAMDSVFIGPSERQTLLLEFLNDDPSIFIEDLLREIEEFAAEEGPRLLQDGGKISVINNILPVIRTYRRMVRQAQEPANIKSIPDGYRTIRVRRSLDDLHDQLHELTRLAEPVTQQVPRPVEQPEFFITSIQPNVITVSETLNGKKLHIIGGGFLQGDLTVTISLAHRPTIKVTVISENLLAARLSGWNSTAGTYDVTITSQARGLTDTLKGGLHVIPDE